MGLLGPLPFARRLIGLLLKELGNFESLSQQWVVELALGCQCANAQRLEGSSRVPEGVKRVISLLIEDTHRKEGLLWWSGPPLGNLTNVARTLFA